MDEPFRPDMTLAEARELLRERVVDRGEDHDCPCCDRKAKVYRRAGNATMTRALLSLYRAGRAEEFVHAPSLPGDMHEISQWAWWGLVEEHPGKRDDGGKAGMWRVTPKGEAWIKGLITIPKAALVFQAKVRRYDGPNVTVAEQLGEPFSFAELMGTSAPVVPQAAPPVAVNGGSDDADMALFAPEPSASPRSALFDTD